MTTGEQPAASALHETLGPQADIPHAQLLERLREHPLELDMSFAEEGAALLAQLNEGLYRYRDTADALLPPDITDKGRRLFYNVIITSDRFVRLAGSDFFLKNTVETTGMSIADRAEAIIERIAKLAEETPGMFLQDAIEHIRREGQLLTEPEHEIAAVVACRTPRLLLQYEKKTPDAERTKQVTGVLAHAPRPPATIGDGLDELIATTYRGDEATGYRWLGRLCDRLCFTASTTQAFYRAIELDPRFVPIRYGDGPHSSVYSAGLAEGALPPLPTKRDIYNTPPEELARWVLARWATCDLRRKSDVPVTLAPNKELANETVRHIVQAIMRDPRVTAMENTNYIRVTHTPEDAAKFETLFQTVTSTIENLLSQSTIFIDTEELHMRVHETAVNRGIKADKTVGRILRRMVDYHPRVRWSPRERTQQLLTSEQARQIADARSKEHIYSLMLSFAEAAKAPPEPVIAEAQHSLVDAPPDTTEIETQVQAAAATRSLELMRLLGRERVTEIHGAVQVAISKCIDPRTTTSILLNRLVSVAEGELTLQTRGPLSAEETEYLTGVFMHHEKLVPTDRDGIFGVRPPSAG